MSCIIECNLRFYLHSFSCLSGRGAEARASVERGVLRAASVPHCQLCVGPIVFCSCLPCLSPLSNYAWKTMLLSFSGSIISDSCDSMTVSCQAPLSLRFSRGEYRSGWAFPSPGALSNAGIKPASPVLSVGFFYC